MDVFLVRKLGVPWQPELGFGAIAETPGTDPPVRVIDQGLVRECELTPKVIEEIAAREQREIDRRSRLYRGTRSHDRGSWQGSHHRRRRSGHGQYHAGRGSRSSPSGRQANRGRRTRRSPVDTCDACAGKPTRSYACLLPSPSNQSEPGMRTLPSLPTAMCRTHFPQWPPRLAVKMHNRGCYVALQKNLVPCGLLRHRARPWFRT